MKNFDAKSHRGIFIGYYKNSKAYNLLDLETKKVLFSTDIYFFEDKGWNWMKTADSASKTTPNYIFIGDLGDDTANGQVDTSQPLIFANEWTNSTQHFDDSSPTASR